MSRLSWLRRPATAWALAGLVLLLTAALIPVSLAAGQVVLATGTLIGVALPFAAVGLVVARHQPSNPIGWLMLWLAVGFMVYADSGLYDVIGYRLGHRLPLSPAVLILYHVCEPLLGLLPLVILLFPEGRLPSPRWRWVLRSYLALAVIDMIMQGQMCVYALTHHRTQVDTSGQLTLSDGSYSVVFAPIALIFFGFWALSVGHQVVSWRRSAGDRRQQLNWLMAGAAGALVLYIAAAFVGAAHGGWQVVSDVLVIGLAALPVAIGVGILKYRLYEIERIVSRTLAYAIVTGLLVGVYAGLVLLATQVLSLSSPVAVAAATLAAAALFSPVRRRVQLRVDRRFNRARYDGERTVEAFAARLKDAVDLDMVRGDLAGVVSRALEPAHVTVWTARD